MDGHEKKLYRCCFCNIIIGSTHINPCAIDALININKPKNKQYNQVFYCHIECLEEQLHEKMRYYLALDCLVPKSNNGQ